jgi:hypothetical protein
MILLWLNTAMQSDMYATLEREAFALALETQHLNNKNAVKLSDITNEFDPSKEFIISFDSDEDINEQYYCEYVNYPTEEDNGRYPYVTIYSESSSLKDAILNLDKKIEIWKNYFNGEIINNDKIKKSKNGSLFHFKYDKTIIGIKYGEHLIYPKFNFKSLEWKYSFLDPIQTKDSIDIVELNNLESDYDYCQFSSLEEMVNTWRYLQKSRDTVSRCRSGVSKSWEVCEWDNVPKLTSRNKIDIIEQFETFIDIIKN